MRRLVTPAKRIILSNVNLCIPHDIQETEIQRIGYKLASPMNALRAGIPGEEFSHILSFRRQLYVFPNEAIELLNFVDINHEDISQRIFLIFDAVTCFN